MDLSFTDKSIYLDMCTCAIFIRRINRKLTQVKKSDVRSSTILSRGGARIFCQGGLSPPKNFNEKYRNEQVF